MQSRRGSLIESCVDVGIGFVLSVTSQIIVYPWYGIHVDLVAQLKLCLTFTAISLARRFITRRLFNGVLRKLCP